MPLGFGSVQAPPLLGSVQSTVLGAPSGRDPSLLSTRTMARPVGSPAGRQRSGEGIMGGRRLTSCLVRHAANDTGRSHPKALAGFTVGRRHDRAVPLSGKDRNAVEHCCRRVVSVLAKIRRNFHLRPKTPVPSASMTESGCWSIDARIIAWVEPPIHRNRVLTLGRSRISGGETSTHFPEGSVRLQSKWP